LKKKRIISDFFFNVSIDPGQCRLVAAPDGGLEYKVTIKEISITNVTSPVNIEYFLFYKK